MYFPPYRFQNFISYRFFYASWVGIPFTARPKAALITFIHSFHKHLLRRHLLQGQCSRRWGASSVHILIGLLLWTSISYSPVLKIQGSESREAMDRSTCPFWGLFQYPTVSGDWSKMRHTLADGLIFAGNLFHLTHPQGCFLFLSLPT